jgi:hypothetical protein
MDYKEKYLKYKRKYLELKNSYGRGYGNHFVGNVNDNPNYGMNNFNLDAIIQNVLRLNDAELNRRRAILRNANFGPNIPDPLNRPDKPPDPRPGPVRRAWAIMRREDDEQVNDERKIYLLNNYYLANWGDRPPSWWPFNR